MSERDRKTEHERAEEALRLRDRAIAASSNGIVITDPDLADNPIVYVNPAFERITGYSFEEATGRNCRFLQGADRDQPARHELRDALREGREWTGVLRNYKKDGAVFHNEVYVAPVRGEDGRVTHFVGVQNDVTERLRAEEGLRRSERFLAEAQRIARVGSWEYEADVGEARWSDELYRILGLAPGQCAPTRETFMRFVHPEDRSFVERSGRTASDRRGRSSVEFRVVRPDGTVRVVQNHHEVVFDDEEAARPSRVTGTVQDITERKALEERLEHQALRDPLTGLPNRALFSDRLGRALSRAERRGGAVAVLFLDLDGFKVINDSLGHGAGDRLLVAVAERLGARLRAGEMLARFGGDEFTVLLEGVAGEGDASRVAERIGENLRSPFALGGRKAFVTASVGIALGSPGRDRPGELLRRADAAMYRAKAAGRAGYAVFEESMNAAALERLELEADLRRALERDEFRVHYQPKVELETGRIVGTEALLRWEHPGRGLLAPSEFVALAEETGLIVPIGEAVLGEACRQTREWQGQCPGSAEGPPLAVNVNLSARQFRRPGLVEEVGRILRETGLDPRHLDLEITESAAMEDAEASASSMA